MTKSIDEIIREAMERGDFDNLPNKGKKLNLDDYFDTPEDLRLGYSVLKSADFVPEEVLIKQEIAALESKLAATSINAEREKILKELEHQRLKFNLLMERFNRHKGV